MLSFGVARSAASPSESALILRIRSDWVGLAGSAAFPSSRSARPRQGWPSAPSLRKAGFALDPGSALHGGRTGCAAEQRCSLFSARGGSDDCSRNFVRSRWRVARCGGCCFSPGPFAGGADAASGSVRVLELRRGAACPGQAERRPVLDCIRRSERVEGGSSTGSVVRICGGWRGGDAAL